MICWNHNGAGFWYLIWIWIYVCIEFQSPQLVFNLWNQNWTNFYDPLNSVSILVLILWICKVTGFSKTETLMLLQTSGLVGSCAIFSTSSISSGRTEPKTVYAFFHSLWLAKLIKNSGPEPTHATDPLLIVGQASVGISLKIVPRASSVPWISAKGGPNGAYIDHVRLFWVRKLNIQEQYNFISYK